ncbi:MAG: caspase family protein [Campylobacterota bacterium]|nr:caspase family protein [Campylobacterota bacterium]
MSIWHKTSYYDEVCTHVLVIGTSKYTYLPDDITSDDEKLLGLTSVSTPATSAYRFACWIKESYNNSKAPLGSIRLLLAPSQKEIDNEPQLGQLNQPLPDSSNVEDALYAWQNDCLKFREGHCIVYIAGHGIRLSGDLGIVLLEDFGKPNRSILEGALDIGNIHQAMAQDSAAKNQFYFVDACAIEPKLFAQYISAKTGINLDIKRGESVESSPIFFGAAPETLALGKPGEGTLFIQVLLQCLRSDAAKADDQNNPKNWLVSTLELFKQLQKGVKELAMSYNETQSVVLGGISSNTVFHESEDPPVITLTVSLSPQSAVQYAKYTLINLTTNEKFELFPFESPYIDVVNPGVYRIEFDMTEDSHHSGKIVPAIIISPPRHDEEIVL